MQADLRQAGQALFEDVWHRFVEPEVARRREAGREDERALVVYALQVLLHPAREPEVRINDQVRGTMQGVAARELEAGEDVTIDDLLTLTGFTLALEDAEIPYVAAFAHREGWSLSFDFSRRHERRFEYLDRGREYSATAREVLKADRLGVALDNAYSAVELLAKAELLSCGPTIGDVLASRSHGGVATPYSLWARLGNTDQRFVRLLYRLQNLRSAGRYLHRDLSLASGEPEDLFALLAEMEEHVAAAVAGGAPGSEGHWFNVIATRDISAGQLVGPSDFTLKSPKTPKAD